MFITKFYCSTDMLPHVFLLFSRPFLNNTLEIRLKNETTFSVLLKLLYTIVYI